MPFLPTDKVTVTDVIFSKMGGGGRGRGANFGIA